MLEGLDYTPPTSIVLFLPGEDEILIQTWVVLYYLDPDPMLLFSPRLKKDCQRIVTSAQHCALEEYAVRRSVRWIVVRFGLTEGVLDCVTNV